MFSPLSSPAFRGFGFRLPVWPRWYLRFGWWVSADYRPFFKLRNAFNLGWQVDLWRLSVSYSR